MKNLQGMIAEMEKHMGKKWKLSAMTETTINCSQLISCGLKKFNNVGGVVSKIDQMTEKVLSLEEVQPGDLIIWRASDGNHIELVVEFPKFDKENECRMVKTLGSAKNLPAFQRQQDTPQANKSCTIELDEAKQPAPLQLQEQ
ncbi:MAG: hypothetical protein LBG52_08710 [Candidatus Peribacteria bacterium]|nr:hypothetical protein [Candidatus Peribacteria bacterium]